MQYWNCVKMFYFFCVVLKYWCAFVWWWLCVWHGQIKRFNIYAYHIGLFILNWVWPGGSSSCQCSWELDSEAYGYGSYSWPSHTELVLGQASSSDACLYLCLPILNCLYSRCRVRDQGLGLCQLTMLYRSCRFSSRWKMEILVSSVTLVAHKLQDQNHVKQIQCARCNLHGSTQQRAEVKCSVVMW
jgi:hypothetical protein